MRIDTYGFRYTSMGRILPEYVCFVGSICLLINGNVIENDGKTNDEITATLIMVDWVFICMKQIRGSNTIKITDDNQFPKCSDKEDIEK